jgi:centrosomal protein CEP104
MAVLKALCEVQPGAVTLEQAMPLLGTCLESPVHEVREAACDACAALAAACDAAPESVMRMLPKNLKAAMRDAVAKALGISVAALPARGSALPPGLAATTRRSGPGAMSKTDGAVGRSSVGKGPAKAPAPPTGLPASGLPAGMPSANRAIVALTNELRSKEREYGLSHPDVAVLLTDLAALYSEEEQFTEAQPLYERALRIQENVLGGEHPDTVQTLTDLAICHLDQGANHLGRPLLERALALQEAALGPDHPDVAAVRDVLASLDAEAMAGGEQ